MIFYFLEKEHNYKILQPDHLQARKVHMPLGTWHRNLSPFRIGLLEIAPGTFVLSLQTGTLINIKTSLGNVPFLPQVSPHDAICFCIDLRGLGVLGGFEGTYYSFLF